MSYKDYLKQRIRELESRVANDKQELDEIQKELNKLRLAEFEEDLTNESTQQFLKG